MAKLIVVSSPLRGNYTYNLKKAAEVCRKLIEKDYAPMATHLFYMKAKLLNDRIDSHRKKGILHTFEWMKAVDRVIFITKEDGTLSEGCKAELEFAKKNCIPYVVISWELDDFDTAIEELEEQVETWKA